MAKVSYPGLFPFCVQPTEDSTLIGANTWYPVGMSVKDAVHLYWKSKNFQPSGSVSGNIGGADVTFGPFDFVYNKYISPPQSETDFICGNKDSYSRWMWYEWLASPQTIISNATYLSYYFGEGIDRPEAYLYNGLIYPFLIFVSFGATNQGYKSDDLITAYYVPLTINGSTYQLPMVISSTISSFYYSNLSIKETEVWPYNA
jgi:hypothetical protein